jgi:hypothetical protein
MSKQIFDVKAVSALPTVDIIKNHAYLLLADDGTKKKGTMWTYIGSAWFSTIPTTLSVTSLTVATLIEAVSGAGILIDGATIKDGTITFANGTVTAPSVKVGEETGFYLSSAGTLGVSVGGVFVGRFTEKKGLELNDSSIGELKTGSTVVNNNIDPATKSVFASDLIAGKIFTGTPTGNIDYTLPTGTEMDTANNGTFLTNYGIEVPVINLSVNTITLVASSGFTIVGGAVVLANTSARFKVVKTGTNTYVAYRVG